MLKELKEGFVVTPEEQELIDSFKQSILLLRDWKNLVCALFILILFMTSYCGLIVLGELVRPILGA